MNLRTKIFGSIGAILVMMAAVSGVALYKMSAIGALLVEIAEEDIPLTNIVAAN